MPERRGRAQRPVFVAARHALSLPDCARHHHRAADEHQRRGRLPGLEQDSLELRREKDGVHIACARCRTDLGSPKANYKERCVRRDADITSANPNIGDYRRYIDDRPVFRQFFCPGCGALIENEVARENDPILHDIELQLPR